MTEPASPRRPSNPWTPAAIRKRIARLRKTEKRLIQVQRLMLLEKTVSDAVLALIEENEKIREQLI